jgi:hypothetical protein
VVLLDISRFCIHLLYSRSAAVNTNTAAYDSIFEIHEFRSKKHQANLDLSNAG